MNKTTLILSGAAVLILLMLGVFWYATSHLSVGAASPGGSTFGDAKIAAISWNPATSAASSTSILNTDGSSRIIVSSFLSCTGQNGQGFTMTAATTTNPGTTTGLQGSTNYAANDVATTTTGSSNMFVASSTEGVPTYSNRVWPANVYLTFLASATNAGNCTAGVYYLGT